MTTCCTSALIPAFSIQSRDVSQIIAACQAQFGVNNSQDLELFALVPLTQETLNHHLDKNTGDQNFEICVRMNSPSFSNLTIRNIENSMLEK